ncbi:hypothetical protein JOE61_004101 [Nocardioides salarius]|uniref:Restriction endonuclease subunit S n=1 Tax=Nocardioides salarius TaxID=374513 RepID=A0ABS2MGP7_9ACTN|nr:hypothetical protein [Nocardioides salarius]MBM7510287.1 hypothetical protein [Nocardioides salarius]
MISTTVVSLRERPTWDPAALTAEALQWPGPSRHTLPLRDLSRSLLADGWVEHDVPVITPASLDPVGGGIRKRSRKYRGAAFQVGSQERGLRAGDVLVPMNPDLPLLLVRPEHVGSLVSSTFLALRPHDGLALWIWAVLTSRTGRQFRSHLAVGSAGRSTTKAALLDLEIPVPPLAEAGATEGRLLAIEQGTHREEEEAGGTWWRTADLTTGDWSIALATPNPDVLDFGIPLGDLCSEIARGRAVPREDYREAPEPGYLAVTDIAVLGGKPVRRWVPLEPRPRVIAHPGDLFVAAVGARPHAVVAIAETAVDRNLFVLRLRDPSLGPAVAHYLNGQTGYGLRQVLLTGDFIPGMRKNNLARLPIPAEALEYTGRAEPLVPLDLQLEHVLWD